MNLRSRRAIYFVVIFLLGFLYGAVKNDTTEFKSAFCEKSIIKSDDGLQQHGSVPLQTKRD